MHKTAVERRKERGAESLGKEVAMRRLNCQDGDGRKVMDRRFCRETLLWKGVNIPLTEIDRWCDVC